MLLVASWVGGYACTRFPVPKTRTFQNYGDGMSGPVIGEVFGHNRLRS